MERAMNMSNLGLNVYDFRGVACHCDTDDCNSQPFESPPHSDSTPQGTSVTGVSRHPTECRATRRNVAPPDGMSRHQTESRAINWSVATPARVSRDSRHPALHTWHCSENAVTRTHNSACNNSTNGRLRNCTKIAAFWGTHADGICFRLQMVPD